MTTYGLQSPDSFTHVNPDTGVQESWRVHSIDFQSLTDAEVVLAQHGRVTRRFNIPVRFQAQVEGRGLRLMPTTPTQEGLAPSAQPLLYDRARVAAAARLVATRIQGSPQDYTDADYWIAVMESTALIWELENPDARTSALSALHAGYTGPVDDLLAAATSASTP